MKMKLSTILLAIMILLFVGGLLASNIILKREYDKADKSDIYWNYGKILEQPFRHIVIKGGKLNYYKNNIAGNVVFEQSPAHSVRVLKNWIGYEKGSVK